MTDITVHHPVAEHIIIFGDCWPVVSAVESVIMTIHPECVCNTVTDLSSLIYQLTCKPQALLILCLHPREHIFLFYALREELVYHPTLVISNELFLSDRLILSAWGDIPCMLHKELEPMITSLCPERNALTGFLIAPCLPSGFSEVPQIFHLKERLMDYMSLLMYREMLNRGLTPFRMRLLEAIWTGYLTHNELAEILDEPRRKIWNEKYRLLNQLGIPGNRLRETLYGTRFCLFLQKTPFMSLSEAGNIRENARSSQTGASKDFPAGTAA